MKCNKILKIHSKWLFNNDYIDEWIECTKQKKNFKKNNDLRQTEGYSRKRRKKNEMEQEI